MRFPPLRPKLPATPHRRWQAAVWSLHRARVAWQQGRQEAARAWARLAARLTPEWERPWYFLGLWAEEPQARVLYLQKALECNPRSREVRRALRLALREVQRQGLRIALERPGLPPRSRIWLQHMARLLMGMFLAGLLLGLSLWWNARGRAWVAAAVMAAFPSPPVRPLWNVSRATLTPTPTPTATPTPTPTPSPTPTPTPSPTPTATPTPTVTPTPSPTPLRPPQMPPGIDIGPQERWIEVDLSEQKLYAYEGTRLVREFVVSTGRWPFVTVTGVYRIQTKLESTLMVGPGYYLPNVPYTMYFYKGYAIHGTYWHNNFGTPMSHGCINMRTEEARWLFFWASVGTLVYIHP